MRILLNRNKVSFFILIILLLLTACGNITIELKHDGSGKMMIEIPNNEFISAEEIRSELEREIDVNDGVKRLSVKEKGQVIEAKFQFDDMSSVDPYSYQIPVADYAILNDDRLESLEMVDENLEFTEKSSATFVQLPSDLNDFDQSRIILDGKVVAHSEGIELIKDNTIEVVSYGDGYVVYEPKTRLGSFLWGAIILVIGAGVFYFIRKNNQKSPNITEKADAHA